MTERLAIVDEIARVCAMQIGVANHELLFSVDRRGYVVQRARSLAIAVAHAGISDLTNEQIGAQFGRDRSTVTYHAAEWRLPSNARDWNTAVSALKARGWASAPPRR